MLTPLLTWLAVVDLLGWLHFPLCFRVARHLRDRGLGLCKLAGAFLPAYGAWLAAHTPILHTRLTIVAVIGVLALWNALLFRRDRRRYAAFFARRWPILLVLEGVFWGGAVAAALIRAQIPAIAFDPNWYGAEKWSDFNLLSTFCRQLHFPAIDPWLAGFPINYYYYGHLAWATLAKLLATPPQVAYNLGLALIVALALTLCVSLGYHLFRSTLLGLVLAWLVVCGGNFKPLAELLQSYLEQGHFVPRVDFWDTSRAMGFGAMGLFKGSEINEFPSFSFILGDLHPHFSAHPVFLAFLLILAALWRAAQRETFWARDVLMGRLTQWLTLAFLAGLLYATNSWDCFVALFLAALALPFARGFRRWPLAGRAVLALFIGAITCVFALRLFFLPYDLVFVPPKSFQVAFTRWFPFLHVATPLAVVPTALRSSVSQWLFYFGLFVLPCAAWLTWGTWKRTKSIPNDRAAAVFALALAAGLLAYIHGQKALVGILAFALVALAPSAFRRRRHDRLELAAILSWLAVLVSFVCEWLFYDDNFSGPDERINTIFKVYYCLWPVTALGAVAAVSALWGGRNAPRPALRRVAAVLLLLILLAISSLYPLFAWTSRIGDYRRLDIAFGARPTLDGLQYLERLPATLEEYRNALSTWMAQPEAREEIEAEYGTEPTINGLSNLESLAGYYDDWRAAHWLRDHVSPYTVVAEASHWGYSAAGRFAALGGVLSVLGWSQHEDSWRKGFGWEIVSTRATDLDELFTTTSLQGAASILVLNRVDYVAVGWLERSRYPDAALRKFALLGKEVFRSGSTRLYAVSPAGRAELQLPGGVP